MKSNLSKHINNEETQSHQQLLQDMAQKNSKILGGVGQNSASLPPQSNGRKAGQQHYTSEFLKQKQQKQGV
jgi:hypothetical protein